MRRKQIDFQSVLNAISGGAIINVPQGPNATNQILAEMLYTMKILVAAQDVAIEWSTHETWVKPGTKSTLLSKVQPGEVSVLKLTNYDVDQAAPIYYAAKESVRASTQQGVLFPARTFTAANNDIDFSEDAMVSWLLATITAGTYNDPDVLAAEIQTQMNAAGGGATYSVRFLTSSRKFQAESNLAGGVTFDIGWLSGPNTLTSAGSQLGYAVAADDSGEEYYTADDQLIVDIGEDSHITIGDPLLAGDMIMVVADTSIYAVLDSTTKLPVPVSVRSSRIIAKAV